MTHRAPAILGVALVLALAGCDAVEPSEFVNQDRIYTDYQLHYDANEDVTEAQAIFRLGNSGGTLLELTGGSYVTVNDEGMARTGQAALHSLHYRRRVGGHIGHATFRFVDTESRAYENVIVLNRIDHPAGGLGTIDNDANYELRWQGPALAHGEEVVVRLYRASDHNPFDETELADFHTYEVGARSIVLRRGELSSLVPGEVTLVLERRVQGTLAERTTAGGRIAARYTAPKRRVQITD
jgi:hypothetical protein